MKKTLSSLILFIVFTLALAGCGAAGNTTSETPATGSAEPATEAAAGPVTVKDSRGEVTLDQPAKRVVVLEWTFTENVIALGVQPVGNADNAGYTQYVTSEAALDANVTDVGTRDEPNLEAIAALKPDLIITDSSKNKIYDQLKAIAPTLEYNMYEEGNGYDYNRMTEVFNSVATALGKEEQAKTVLDQLDQHYAEAKQKLADAGKADFHYVITQAYTWQNAATLRMFTDNSVVVSTLDKIGMVNDWKSEKSEPYGFNTVGIEALSGVQDSNFLYIVQPDDDVFGAAMKDNSVWNGLNFVKENRTYALNSKVWTFGGPLSSKALVDYTVEAITKG